MTHCTTSVPPLTPLQTDVMSEERENQFCQLWDMTSDRQVGAFMIEKGVCDLLIAPLARSKHYRVKEISLGILANLMCHRASAQVALVTLLVTLLVILLQSDPDLPGCSRRGKGFCPVNRGVRNKLPH